MNSTILHRNAAAKTAIPAPEPPTVRAQLRARTRYYERHVLAWYALGRAQDARAAWAAVCEMRNRMTDTELDAGSPTSALDVYLGRG